MSKSKNIIIILSILLTIAILSEAKGEQVSIVRPDEDVYISPPGWYATPQGSYYAKINDPVFQPNPPDPSIGYLYAYGNTISTYQAGFESIGNADTITRVKVWTYGKKQNAQPDSTAQVRIKMGATWSALQNLIVPNSTRPDWTSNTFSGSWTKADLDNLVVEYYFYYNSVPLPVAYVYASYCEVTYDVASGQSPDRWTSDLRLTNASEQSKMPSIEIEGQNVYVVWEEYRNDPNNPDIFFKKSSDLGINWTTDTNLTPAVTTLCGWPKIASDGSNIHIVWTDMREGTPQVYYKKVNSNGGVLIDDRKLTPASYQSSRYDIAASTSSVYVAMVVEEPGAQSLSFRRSNDGGLTWQDGNFLDTQTLIGRPAITWDKSTNDISIIYNARTGTTWDVFWFRGREGGGSWDAKQNISSSGYPYYNGFDTYVDIATDGSGGIHAVWAEGHSSLPQRVERVRYRGATNSGGTWSWGTPIDIGAVNSSTAPADGLYEVSVGAKANNVYVVWDEMSPDSTYGKVWYRKSGNRGNSWYAVEELPDEENARYALVPDIALDYNGEAHAIWSDSRFHGGVGNSEIFYKRTDNRVPWVSATPSSSNWTNSNIAITLSARDNNGGSGIEVARYRWDNPDAANGTTYTNGQIITLSSEGTHRLYLWARDNARNETTWSSAEYRLDKTAPTPNPAQWATAPYALGVSSITMVAQTAADALQPGTELYYFDELSGNPGGTDSGLQNYRVYTDTGLSTNTPYSYRVKYRDGVGNETAYSTTIARYTLAPLPTNVAAQPLSPDTIQLSVDSFPNDSMANSGYRWDRDDGTGWVYVSGWRSFNDSGLEPNREYRYRVQYRNGDGIATPWVYASTYTHANVPGQPNVVVPEVTGVTDTLYIEIDPNGNTDWTKYSIKVTTITLGEVWYVQGDTTTGIYSLGASPEYYAKSEWEGTNGWAILTGLLANTQYRVSVNAVNGLGVVSLYGDPGVRYTRAPDPTGVTATVLSVDAISLAVDQFPNDSLGQSGYHWECIGLSPGATGGNGATIRTYIDTGLATNQRYQHSIYYTNGDGEPTATVYAQPLYTLANVPNLPNLTLPLAQLSDRINIVIGPNGNPNWTKYSIRVTTVTEGGTIFYVQGSTTTKIYRLGPSPEYYGKGQWEGPNGAILTGLLVNTQYGVSVNAKNGDGITTDYGNTSSIYTKANIPDIPGLTVRSDTEINVDINENNNPLWTMYSIRALSEGATYYVKSDKTLQLWNGDPSAVATYLTRIEWGGENLNVTGLNPNTRYEFSVNGKNGNGVNTEYSLSSSSWTYAPVPEYPYPYAEAISTGSIRLVVERFRNDTLGQSGYHWECIYEEVPSGSHSGIRVSNPVVVDTGLLPNRQYGYGVYLTNFEGIASSTRPTNRPYTFANVPANISFSDITNQQIRINWDANGNPVGTEYQAHCWGTMEYPLGGYSVEIDTSSAWTTDMSWLFENLCPHTSYYFEVKARNHDNIEASSAILSTSTLNNLPEVPLSLSPNAGETISDNSGLVTLSGLFLDTTDSFSLGWIDVTEEGWIRFQLSTNPDVGNYVVYSGTGNRVQSGQKSGWRPRPLSHGWWYWRARAEDMAAGYSVWSDTRSLFMNYNAPYIDYYSLQPLTADSDPFPSLGDPIRRYYVASTTPTFSAKYEDINFDSGWVDFAISTSTDFGNVIARTTVLANLSPGVTSTVVSFIPGESLGCGRRFWKISGYDVQGTTAPTMAPVQFIINRPPDIPDLVSPAAGYATYVTTPTFKVYYLDQDAGLNFGEALPTSGEVKIQISTSSTDWSEGSILVDSDWFSAQNGSTVTWSVIEPIRRKDGKLYFGTLYWRAIAKDNHEMESSWSEPRSLVIQNVPPDSSAVLNVSPRNPYPDSDLTFSWLFYDRNMGDSQTYYEIQLDLTNQWDPPMWTTATALSGSWNSVVEAVHSGSAIGLGYDKRYYWRVRVCDQEGATSDWSRAFFKTSIFGTPELSAEADDTRSIVIGDLNNDGDLDYVVGNYGTNRVYLNRRTSWEVVNLSAGEYTKSVALSDVNNDGYLDIIFGNSGNNGQANEVYINNPGNPGRQFTRYPSNENEKTYSVAVGDLDNDGDIDYVAGNLGRQRIYVNERGQFASHPTTLGESDETYSVAIGDVDNDGDLDIIAGLYNSSRNLILYRNNGSLNFAREEIICNVNVNAVALADLNGDGSLDICAGTPGGNNSRIYWNNGLGGFISSTPLDESGYDTTSVALGDLENDGVLDIVLGNYVGPNLIYEGGQFTTPYEYSVEQDTTNCVALGDLDNDGDLDLIVGNGGFQPNRIYRSRKSETIPNEPPTAPQILSSEFVDGKLELSWEDERDDLSGRNQLYYAFRLWSIDGSTVVSGSYGTPLLGNYIRPKLGLTRNGIKLNWTEGTTCFWQVRTIDSGLRPGEWSDVRAYAPGIYPPLAPTDFSGVAVSGTEINWTWKDNSSGEMQESSFKLYDRDNTSEPIVSLLPDTTWYLEAGLIPNTSYHRFVRAWNIAGSSDSAVASEWTKANPPLPTGQFDVYSTSITAHWLENGNPMGTEYRSRCGDSPDVEGTVIGESDWITDTLWTSSGLRESVWYYFWAKARNHIGEETDWVFLGSTYIGWAGNNAPTVEFVSDPEQLTDGSGKFDIIVKVYDIDDNECMLGLEYSTGTVWNKATSTDAVDGYGSTLTVDNGRDYQISGISHTSSTNTITFKWDSKKDLPPREYDIVRLKVKVYDTYNSGTDYATVSVDLYCQPPASFTLLSRSTDTITFQWSQTPGVSGYEIWYSTEAGLPNYSKTVFDDGRATSGTITGLTPNTTYYSQISSYDTFGNIGLRDGIVEKPTMVAKPGRPLVYGLYGEAFGHIGCYTRITADTITMNGNPSDTLYGIKFVGNGNWLQGNGATGSSPVLKTISGWQTGDTNTHTGLDPNTEYGYIIRAYGHGGEWEESSAVGYGLTPPLAPTILQVIGMPVDAPDYLEVSWTSPSGAITYKVYVSTVSGGEPIDVVTGIAETSHDYDVDGGTPTVVTSIEVKDVGDKEIHLSWTKPIGELEPSATYYFKVSGVNGYESEGPKSSEKKGQLRPVIDVYNLYRYDLIGDATEQIQVEIVKPPRQLETLIDNAVTPNTKYSYSVSAVSSDGFEGPLSCSTVARLTLAAIPEPRSFTNITTTSIEANWDYNGNPVWTEYQVECSTKSSFETKLSGKDWTVNISSWVSSNLSVNASYWFRVQARNLAGTTTEWRILGSTYTLADTPGAPILVSTTTPRGLLAILVKIDPRTNPDYTEYSIKVRYEDPTGWVEKYLQAPEGGLAVMGDTETFRSYGVWGGTNGVKNIQAIDRNLIGNTTYYYQVTARNGSGIRTEPSPESSIETPAWLPVIWAKGSDGRDVESGDSINVDKVTFTIIGSDRYYYEWTTSIDVVVSTATGVSLAGPTAVTTLTLEGETSWYLYVLGWSDAMVGPTGQTTFGPITYDTQKPLVTLTVSSGRILPDGEIVGVLPEPINTYMEAKFTKVMRTIAVEDGLELLAIRNNLNERINEEVPLNFEWDASTKTVTLTLKSGELRKNYLYRLQVTDRMRDIAGNTVINQRELVFRAIMDHEEKNVITKLPGEMVVVSLKEYSLSRDGYLVINTDPLTRPEKIDPGKIDEANRKIIDNGDSYQYPIDGCLWEFVVYDREGRQVNDGLNASAKIVLPYVEDSNGTVGNSGLLVKEETLRAFWLDEQHSIWVRVPTSTVDKDNNIVTVEVPNFSIYAIMGSAFYDLTDAHAYPVPWKPNDGIEETGTEEKGITFTKLSTEGVIKIYTLSGELVMKYEFKPADSGQWKWDVKTANGDKVFSGVYIYYIENEKEHKTGKLIIIR